MTPLLKELWRRVPARLCLLAALAYALAALWGGAEWLRHRGEPSAPFNHVREQARNLPPALERGRLLGTDNLGRDVAPRLAQGARIAFQIGVSTSLLSVALGALLGLVAGFFGRVADTAVQLLCAVFSAVPSILLIIALTLLTGKGLFALFLALSLTTWVSTCRQVRAETLRQRHLPYVLAAQTLGYSRWRILSRHVFPNTAHILLVAFSTRFPVAVSTEVFISFLGIGAQDQPSWGVMLNNARGGLWQGCWWELTFASLALFLLLLAFNHLADTLRDLLDPALRA